MDKTYDIFRITLSKVGVSAEYHDYVVATDITVLYEYFEKTGDIKNITAIDKISYLSSTYFPENFFDDTDKLFYLYNIEYRGLYEPKFGFCIAEKMSQIHEIMNINPEEILTINKIDIVRYIKSFKEVDDEIENMRIG